jgi:hypothetical protein
MLTSAKIRQVNPHVLAFPASRRFFVVTKLWGCLVIALTLSGCSSRERVEPQAGAFRTVAVTRVVRIPATNEVGTNASGPSEAARLAVSPGSQDELPEGPDGFDVTANGNFLITDPLRKRIAVFDGNGAYRSEWQIGFGADSVTILSGNLVQVREARTGQLHLFDMQGKPAAGSTSQDERAEARLTGPGSGVVNWRGAGGRPGSQLEVKFEKPGLKLLSLQGIALESSGDTYVALESTAGGDAVDLNKIVRRYSPGGKAVNETTDLPLDYFVRPIDEIRVRNGLVYQLMTTKPEVRINVWNMNL